MADTPCSDSKAGCKEVVDHLYTFLDGELNDDTRAAMKAHLDACPPCLDAVDFEADLRRVLAQKCRDRVPDELRARILESLARVDPGE